jgi:MFS family permease
MVAYHIHEILKQLQLPYAYDPRRINQCKQTGDKGMRIKIRHIAAALYTVIAIYLVLSFLLLQALPDEARGQIAAYFSNAYGYRAYLTALVIAALGAGVIAVIYWSSRAEIRAMALALFMGATVLTAIGLFAFGDKSLVLLLANALAFCVWRFPVASARFFPISLAIPAAYPVVALFGFFAPVWLPVVKGVFALDPNGLSHLPEPFFSVVILPYLSLSSCFAGGLVGLTIYYVCRSHPLHGWLTFHFFFLLANVVLSVLSREADVVVNLFTSISSVAFWLTSLLLIVIFTVVAKRDVDDQR